MRAVPARPWARRVLACALAMALIAGLLGVRAALVDAPLERLSATTTATTTTTAGVTEYRGSLYMARGGPYVLGFLSPNGRASLTIEGRQLSVGVGLKSARVVYAPGVREIRFQAPPGARLLWHPPGRRGPLEYLPASALSPDPPERASFGDWAGATPMDGVIAGLIGCVLIACFVYLVWPLFVPVRGSPDRPLHRPTWLLAGAVLVLALGVRVYQIDAAGQTWDEDVNWSAGRNYVTNWLDRDFSTAAWEWNQEHPPVMKYVAGVGAQFADGYDPARALSALMMALACALMVPIGRRLASTRVGVLAGLVAALSPHLIAHGKIVGHEAPTALLWALAIWLALMAHDTPGDVDDKRPGPGASWLHDVLFWRMVVLGVVLGLAVFSRFVNVLLAPLIGAILLIQAPPERRLRTVLMGLAIIAPVALALGFAVWPRLWSHPVLHLQEAWAKLSRPHSAEPFLGAITNRPPPWYFAVYLVATAPLGVLVAAAAWIARAVSRRHELRATLILFAWLGAPMIVMLSPVRQDGVRYIMPCLLALALAAALGVDYLVAQLSRVAAATRVRRVVTEPRVFVGVALVLVGYLALCAARIHPYYLDYYGEHVGGPSAVAEHKRFEIAWWGEGIADAITYVNEHAAPDARVHKECVEPSHLTWLRADLWPRLARDPRDATWIIVYQPTRRACPVPADARLVFEVSAAGAPLTRVYRREQ